MADSTSRPNPINPAGSGWGFAAAGSRPMRDVHPAMASVIPRGQLEKYPRRGFYDIELGSVWTTRQVEEYVAMEQLAVMKRDLAQMSHQKFCQDCGCSSWFEGMTEECCLVVDGLECDFTGERGGRLRRSPRIHVYTPIPETERTQVRGTSTAKGVAKHGTPGTDTDHAPSTSVRVVDDQETRGAIDDPEAVAAFAAAAVAVLAGSFQLS